MKKIIIEDNKMTNRLIKIVTHEFKNLVNYTSEFDINYFKIAKTTKK